MNPSILQQLWQTMTGHNWLPMIAILTLYVRKLASPQSKFPLPIPTVWLPVVSTTGGLVYGLVSSIQGGEAVSQAVFDMLAAGSVAGFADALTTAIFAHNSAPAWARWLVGVFDDVTGGGGGSTVTPAQASSSAFGVRPDQVAPNASKRTFAGLRLAFAGLGVVALLGIAFEGAAPTVAVATVAGVSLLEEGCQNGKLVIPPAVPADVEKDIGCVTDQLAAGVTDPVQIALTCSIPAVQTVIDWIGGIVSKASFQQAHPEVAAKVQALMPEMRRQAAPLQERLDLQRHRAQLDGGS